MTTTIGRTEEMKSLLICQECGYESPIEGDWNVSEPTVAGDRRVYECPDCGATVLAQPVLSIPA